MALLDPTSDAADRPQRQRQYTRRDLLTSAQRVLAQKGYHRTKIADIARDAGIAVGTFYLYFPTKEALFLELVQETVHLLEAELDRARNAALDPRQRARAALETFFNFAHRHRELFRIAFGHDATFHEVVHQAQDLFVNDITRHLTEGMDAGAFRRSNPEVLAHAFIGLSLEVVSWWLEHPDLSVSEVTEPLLAFVLRGLEPA
jgi:AcrR family transcriptional regulator